VNEYRSGEKNVVFEITAYPSRDGIAVFMKDITERKQAEQALEESEERLRLALEATADGIWDWDPRTGQTYFSPRYYTMMGYEPSEFPPTYESWRQMLHPDDREASEEAVQRALEEHTPFAIEFRFKAKNGDWRWILSRGKIAELDEEGKATRVAGSHTDITARKQAQDEIRWLNEELEQRVIERTAQLKTANKELEAFAHSVSHDLRAPLRHITGFVQLLNQREEERLDATSSRYLNVIVESVDRMGQLIDDLLAFSRTGRAEMQVKRVELDELIQEVRQELTPEMEDRHITWEINPLPPVQADPALLRQAWVNLLSNAIKFTAPRPKAHIEIGTVQEKSGGSEVTLFVRDNGVGFDPQYTHKLFGVFQRLHGKDEFEGTGIGLATVRRIVERHGGRVWAEGDLDHGATFYLTLRQAKGK
jgi:hypothetical protein